MLHKKLESYMKNLPSPENPKFSAKIESVVYLTFEDIYKELKREGSTYLSNDNVKAFLGYNIYEAMSSYMMAKGIKINIAYEDIENYTSNPIKFKNDKADTEKPQICKRHKEALKELNDCLEDYTQKIITTAQNDPKDPLNILYLTPNMIKRGLISALGISIGLSVSYKLINDLASSAVAHAKNPSDEVMLCIYGNILAPFAAIGAAIITTIITVLSEVAFYKFYATSTEEKFAKSLAYDIEKITNRFINNASFSQRTPAYERF